jgi:hypothetical protein
MRIETTGEPIRRRRTSRVFRESMMLVAAALAAIFSPQRAGSGHAAGAPMVAAT